jgi:DEAD/DEAH box helicase domain-containing protein
MARRRAREDAHIILTNPDTVHISILPYADRWRSFLQQLRLVVVDGKIHTIMCVFHCILIYIIELHIYTGDFGAHVALIMRRLRRICASYGNERIQFIGCSATIANPAQVRMLTTYTITLLI